MGAPVPKQYLDLAGLPVIEYSLRTFLEHGGIRGVAVALDPADSHWPRTPSADHPAVFPVGGGVERCHSVLNALDALASRARDRDWVLVHDAARPCLRRSDLDRLIRVLDGHAVGGLLGVPVRDTMKAADTEHRVLRTVPRESLWHAYTPQMFRFGLLRHALASALDDGCLVTDDASAVERLGHQPLLVDGHADNIKITRPEDLPLAGFFLEQQGRLC